MIANRIYLLVALFAFTLVALLSVKVFWRNFLARINISEQSKLHVEKQYNFLIFIALLATIISACLIFVGSTPYNTAILKSGIVLLNLCVVAIAALSGSPLAVVVAVRREKNFDSVKRECFYYLQLPVIVAVCILVWWLLFALK